MSKEIEKEDTSTTATALYDDLNAICLPSWTSCRQWSLDAPDFRQVASKRLHAAIEHLSNEASARHASAR